MNAINWKKLLLPNIPYLLFVYLFDKVGQAVRLAPGADLSGKVLSLADGFSAAFTNPLPSLARMDLLIGIVGAVLIRLIVYVKGKNAKKYRKGIEYGSARWGTAEDIKPYTDPVFQNNVLLTQTERLTMNSRPKQPKYARNKNILVIGGSGSGKTRFFVKPNLMQMHSSYVVTDPKGTVLVECGRLLHRGGYRIKVLNTINFKKSMKYKPETDDADSDTEKTLPPFTEGQTFENPAATVTEHDTTPPKPHNEASLLSAMEHAGSEDTDPDAERKGLGTPATRAAVIEKLVKGGFVERKGKQLLPTKDGINLVCVLPDTLTSPQLTAEWENNLTQIAKGKADPAAFMEGIENMARELVKTYPFLSDDKAQMFKPEREALGSCPRCGSPVYEGKKNYYCSNKECIFTMWKNDRFFEERKVTFTPKIAAALLQSGKVNVKKLYSPKTGKTYDGTIVLADTGGKYVNYRVELPKKK